jgi:hypothetical protein
MSDEEVVALLTHVYALLSVTAVPRVVGDEVWTTVVVGGQTRVLKTPLSDFRLDSALLKRNDET